MRIRATCGHCGHELYLAELAWARGGDRGDRCPHCARPLGEQAGTLAERAEHALAALVGALEELRARKLPVEVDARSVLEPLQEALAFGAARSPAPSPAGGP